MHPNPYDPLQRDDLNANEQLVLAFMRDCLHGRREDKIADYVAEDYTQHTPGIGQGRDGLRNYLRAVAWKRPNNAFKPIMIFSDGDFVILYKMLPYALLVDIFRVDADGKLAEHWDVVQPLNDPSYDPMAPSQEDLSRFQDVFKLGDVNDDAPGEP